MERKHPKRLTFELFKEIAHQGAHKFPSQVYFGNDYAIALDMVRPIAQITQTGEPIRVDDMRIGFIKSGEANVILNLIPHHLSVGTLVFLGSESIIQLKHKTEDFNLEGIAITDDLLKVIMHGSIPQPLDQRIQAFTFRLNEADMQYFDQLICLAADCNKYYKENTAMLFDLLSAIFHFFNHIYTSSQQYELTEKTHEREVFDQFISLVNMTEGKERKLAYYADKLYLSQRYLGTIINNVSDITAKEWIDRAAVANIKVLLKHSNLSIKQIADRMKFANDSFFCKYFKRLTGMTPAQYQRL